MAFIRSIGRWAMTGLVINASIGSGIFAVPGELTRLIGLASPIATVVTTFALAVIMAAIVEVASQFPDAGGAYVYVRAAFGRFWGMQVGWFWLLSLLGGGAACINIFVAYLAKFLPAAEHGLLRVLVITLVVAVPTTANYFGVRSGANLCNLFTVAKVLPLVLLIALGILRFHHHIQIVGFSELTQPGWRAWLNALLLLLAAMGGAEDTPAPSGEVKDPRRTIPFAFVAGLLICASLYMLLYVVAIYHCSYDWIYRD